MCIDRRELLKAGVAVLAALPLPRAAQAEVNFDPRPGAWRSFQVVTRVEIMFHRSNILLKFGAKNAAELVRIVFGNQFDQNSSDQTAPSCHPRRC
jgi:hypothetical protein